MIIGWFEFIIEIINQQQTAFMYYIVKKMLESLSVTKKLIKTITLQIE